MQFKEEYMKERLGDLLTKDALNWLKRNKYFEAPASSKHHLAYESGLFEHSLNVAKSLAEFTTKLELTWERPESPWIIGFFHDLCKIDQYIYNPILKKYDWNSDQPVFGHGDKSIIYIEQHLFKLTDEEKACIRWHMGSFDERTNWSKYTDAIHQYPNVLYTHMADMRSTHILEVEAKADANT